MKILKYKKLSNGKYKVSLEKLDLVLYEEVILKYNLLITKDIDPLLIEDISLDNQFYEVYYSALKSIKARFRSVYDIRVLLLKKEFPSDLIDKVIEKLLNQGYLNDLSFTKSFINNQIVTTNKGPNKIKALLLEHRVDSEIIDNEIEVFNKDLQLEKIEKLTNRFYKNNKSRGGVVLKRKITNSLLSYGYDINLIEYVLSKYDFKCDKNIAKKEYEKLLKKYSRKYDGYELKRIINEKMYLKGLKYEEE